MGETMKWERVMGAINLWNVVKTGDKEEYGRGSISSYTKL